MKWEIQKRDVLSVDGGRSIPSFVPISGCLGKIGHNYVPRVHDGIKRGGLRPIKTTSIAYAG